MITYKIIHHIPGRIRIEVPAIKNLSMSELLQISEQFSSIFFISEGIENIRPNPFSGSIVIKYMPEKINIIEYLKEIASSTEMQKLMEGHH
jgi:hypothetical protein